MVRSLPILVCLTALVASHFSSEAAAASFAHYPKRRILRVGPKRLSKRHDCQEASGTISSSVSPTSTPVIDTVETLAQDNETTTTFSTTLPVLQATGSVVANTSDSDSVTVSAPYDASTVTVIVEVTVTQTVERTTEIATFSPLATNIVQSSNMTDVAHPMSSQSLEATQTTVSFNDDTVVPTSTVTSIESAVTESATLSTSNCPAGYTWGRLSDNFVSCPTPSRLWTDRLTIRVVLKTNFDDSKWTFEAGDFNATTFGESGLSMQLRQDMQNLVFQSKSQWIAPVAMKVTMKSTEAPQVVSCVIFKNANTSDEIDLEFVEDTWQVPMWHDSQRLEFGRDVEASLVSSSKNLSSWIYRDADLKPFNNLHIWTVNWTDSALTWHADGKEMIQVNKLNTTELWPHTEPLHIRFGPWLAGDWAGKVNWTRYPNPTQQITAIEVDGCMLA